MRRPFESLEKDSRNMASGLPSGRFLIEGNPWLNITPLWFHQAFFPQRASISGQKPCEKQRFSSSPPKKNESFLVFLGAKN